VVTTRTDRETAAVMAAADIFVLPSLFEGTPLTLIEAMWSALPIVTTATAGMRDVVRDEHNGLLTAPGDVESLVRSLEKLTSDPGLCRALGTAAHKTAATYFTWSRTADAFESAYRAARAAHV